MSVIPSLSANATSALQAGFASLDRAAAAFNTPAQPDPAAVPPVDTVDLRSQSTQLLDPLTTGMTDLLLAGLQVGAGSLLVQADMEHRQQVFDLLNG